MHWGFADIRCALLELAPMVGGTEVGIDSDDPRSPLVSLALPLSVKGIQGKDLLAWCPGLQNVPVVIDRTKDNGVKLTETDRDYV